ncbi:alpha/beta-type small acid-soluble spore protein [Paenibacillus apiarius]|uniref:Alpha/beta-type small acid-soluble spore protein n=1 Tax=Paenibacillus apiarius TaxID=46240 RepID=A0ABT4DQ82_9BACL|nr:alpha/beta-type small acid-soluble spore protein [Paenibacillus apiarius]MBN3524212.1 alpha/beta-type small acid-soluble spore protein [Paenibacillus apiarius]MCY9513997.1 alpha/beta-type small acid-soluble spore protein [Paenibacillus apiarius]MCY9519514.1 alpha/beta-type small acid-soluble spore protein [Paenibacillus apiarius]MCY9552441.1 alpha/beta-type small acid-soluble spore protein [Paenibacillus apiarius]MCY9556270.1 alpha/beta-type small acid-soluble spore protein [Paenibacillus a
MARRSRRKLLVTGAEQGVNAFKAEVMRREGFAVNPNRPDDVKYEVAKTLGVPLQPGDNGNLSTESAGRVGGRIGGTMVREMIRLAQENLAKQPNK